MDHTCHNCGQEYSYVGQHWRRSECPYPEIEGETAEIIQGLLLGDGHLDFCNKSPKLHVTNTNLQFLEWLSERLSNLVSRVYLHSDSQQQSEILEEWKGKTYDCKDVYRLSTFTLKTLEQFSKWYDEDGVHYPRDLSLTPKSLRMWYCSDGTLTEQQRVQIGSKNEMNNEQFIKRLFDPFGVTPERCEWNYYFTRSESEELFEIMGEAPAGMEEKWL